MRQGRECNGDFFTNTCTRTCDDGAFSVESQVVRIKHINLQNFSKNKRHRLCATFFIINLEERTLPGIADKERIISLQ